MGRSSSDLVQQWNSLKGRIDDARYARSYLARISKPDTPSFGATHLQLVSRASGIQDAKGRAGNHPDRVEAEAMQT